MIGVVLDTFLRIQRVTADCTEVRLRVYSTHMVVHFFFFMAAFFMPLFFMALFFFIDFFIDLAIMFESILLLKRYLKLSPSEEPRRNKS